MIDAVEADVFSIKGFKWGEQAKHMTLTGHWFLPKAARVNARWLDSLPEDLRKLVRESAKGLFAEQRKQNRANAAKTLEELKAQTAALYFSDWLAARGVLSKEDALNSHLRDVLWAFGHIASGMVDAQGRPKPYSQLAAIQMGFLNQRGVLVWNAAEKAANGTDTGCFDVDLAKWPAAVDDLARLTFGIKSRGDRALAEKTREGPCGTRSKPRNVRRGSSI